jgi:hypothetical protein
MSGARVMALILISAALTLAGCVTPRSSLSTSAERLAYNADTLARTVSDESASGSWAGYRRDVDALADDAHALRRVTEDRDASDDDVRRAFKRVSRSYLAVRDEVEHSDSRTAREDLHPVTAAYLDVERDMGGYPERPAG